MANATISAPQDTQTGNFSASVSFGSPVTDFQKTGVHLRALSENGITGVDFALTGTDDTYALAFTLPANKGGIFEISIIGMVTPQGETEAEAVMSNTAVVIYDTRTNIIATFGTVEYRNGGVIVVPVTFEESVIAPSKSIFEVSHASGDALTDVTYYIVGTGTAYELFFQIPPDRNGSFNITANGSVLKNATKVWENVAASPATFTVNYDTRVPRIVNFDIPKNYTPGQKFDVILQFNTQVTLSPLPQGSTSFLDHFIFEGADLGQANIYRKTNDTYPTLPIADPLPAEWVNTNLTTETATIYLIRFPSVDANATGIFNMTMKEDAVRGPVS